MTDDHSLPIGKPIPRVDSFQVLDLDCIPFLNDDEKSWPVAALNHRVDSFEVIEPVSFDISRVDEIRVLELTLFLSEGTVLNAHEVDDRLAKVIEAINTTQNGSGYSLGPQSTEPGKFTVVLLPLNLNQALACTTSVMNQLKEAIISEIAFPGVTRVLVRAA